MSTEQDPTAWPAELSARQQAFLECFSRVGSVCQAADGICCRLNHYRWLRESQVYSESFIIARALFAERLRGIAIDRAINGVEEPVIQKGQILRDEKGNVITRRRYSAALLKMLIAWAAKPWEEQIATHSPGSKATNSYTPEAEQAINDLKAAGFTPKPKPGDVIKFRKSIGVVLD